MQPRNDQQLPGADPVADEAGRVEVVFTGEPQEPATGRSGSQGKGEQSRTESGSGFIPRHFVDAAQAQPAPREGPVDP